MYTIIPLICQCGLFIQHVCLKIQFWIMWFFTLNTMSYAEAAIFAKNLLFSHSIVSKRSLVNNTGEVLEWNWQSVPNLNGWKIPLSSDILFKWSHVSFVIFFILFYIERKWLLMRNLATILPLKFKLSGKFQSYR